MKRLVNDFLSLFFGTKEYSKQDLILGSIFLLALFLLSPK